MKKYFKKGLVLLCCFSILLATFLSACGKKAPPKPPVKKSENQKIEKKNK
jgi:predicted small lipoprotein YifL